MQARKHESRLCFKEQPSQYTTDEALMHVSHRK